MLRLRVGATWHFSYCLVIDLKLVADASDGFED